MELTDIKSLDLDELTEYIVSLGEPKFRANSFMNGCMSDLFRDMMR